MSVAEPIKAERDKDAYIRDRNKVITDAIARAKAKNARLRLLKERNEQYLADRVEETDEDEL